MKHRNLTLVTALSLFMLTLSAGAQAPDAPQQEGLQPRLQQMREATAKNEAQLHTYQWIETTTLTMDGKTLPPRQSMCRYSADGTVLKTPLGPQEAPSGGGRGGLIRKAIANDKKEKIQNEVEAVRTLTQMYVPLNQAKLKDALSSGKMSMEKGGSDGDTIVLPDYAKPGDQFRLTLSNSLMQIDRISVKTYFDKPKDTMSVDVQFGTLPDGTLYHSLTTVEAPSKKLTITTTNANFSKLME